jgi:hypothetical protein
VYKRQIKWLLETPTNGKLASVTTKNRVLHSYMPDLVKKRKTHGFEKLLGFNGETYNELYKSHVKRFASSLDGILIGDLKQQLFGE